MFKSKEKMEIERKIRIRKSKTVIQNYISKLERLQKRVFSHGKEYAKLGEQQMVRNQASKYLSTPGLCRPCSSELANPEKFPKRRLHVKETPPNQLSLNFLSRLRVAEVY